MAAPKKGRRAPASQGHPGRTLLLVLIAMAGLIGGMFYSGTMTPRLGIDLAGGTSFTLAAQNQPGKPNAINETNMNTAAGIMERRVNGLGVSEAEVQTQGQDHIIVNIPKGTDAKQARQQVGTTAKLGFRPVITTTAGTKTLSPSPTPPRAARTARARATRPRVTRPRTSRVPSRTPRPRSRRTPSRRRRAVR